MNLYKTKNNLFFNLYYKILGFNYYLNAKKALSIN